MSKFISDQFTGDSSDNRLSVSHRSTGLDRTQMESELWEAFLNDSKLAYKSIYMTYADVLYNYGRKIVPNEELIKDCIQDFFVELWNRRKNLSKVRSIKAYLFVGFRRKLIDKNRKLLRFQKIEETENFEIIFSTRQNILDKKLSEKRIDSLLKALNNLPERQKEAIFLRFYNKLSCNEISEILDVNAQSVYNLIHRALKLLRDNVITLIFLIHIYSEIYCS